MMERPTVIRSYSQKRSSFIKDRDASFSSYLRPEEHKNPGSRSIRASTTTAVDDSAEISIFDAQKYFNELNVDAHQKAITNNNRVSPVDSIAVSDAPRFSSASSSIDGYSNYSSISRNYRARSFHVAATPTASSEASWNSQTGLLSVPPGTTVAVSVRNPLVSTAQEKENKNKNKTPSSSSISNDSFSATRWLTYRRKCPCSGRKSVQVKEKSLRSSKTSSNNIPAPSPTLPQIHDHVPANSMEMLKSETASYKPLISSKPNHHSFQEQRGIKGSTAGFSFPILNVNGSVVPSSSASAMVKLPVLTATVTNLVEDPPRDSLEVFRPPNEISSRKSSSDFLRDRNAVQSFVIVPASPKSRTNNNDDDVASDASSDLFEIESFSTSQTATTATATTASYSPSVFHYHYCHRRDSLDEASSEFQATRRFGPNGASMSMNSRRSVDEPMTEYGYEPSEASIDWSVTTAEGFDRASVTNAWESEHLSSSAMMAAEPERYRRRSGLLSCRCEKAVSVGLQPVKLAASSYGGGSEGKRGNMGPGVRSASGSSTMGMWGVGTTAANKTPLARSHSARLSLPFATS